MSEWWTYRLSDFLMFSPATYWRVVERYNQESWPMHALMFAAAAVSLWLAATRGIEAGRIVAGLLGAAWLWVGWAFHLQTYAEINWAARYLGAAFLLQSALLLVFGMLGRGAGTGPVAPNRVMIGLALAAAGVFLYPLTALLYGRPWMQAEVFGVMPEPTALATLGLLLATGQTRRGLLAVIPLLSLAVGCATLWTMQAQ